MSALEGHIHDANFEKHDEAIMGTFCVAIGPATFLVCEKEEIRGFTTKVIDVAVLDEVANCGFLEREKGTSSQ